MLIPSIDIMDQQAVQLIGGREKAIDAGDPLPLAERFSTVGEIAVIDLDAALGQGSNREIIENLLSVARCRVGGGIRDTKTAIRWLDAGADKVILGTRAVPEILSQLPRNRVIAALDAVDGEVVVEGWRKRTGSGITERMKELSDYVGGFLVTFVEREGRLQGTNMEAVRGLIEAASGAKLTIAGGVTTAQDIAALDELGVDAQVGMALYSGRLGLTEAFSAPLKSERADGLWPTVVVDEHGIALGLAWSSIDSLREAIDSRRGVYHSRKRGLWVKGESSGNIQELLRVDLDCDRDALRFVVKQFGDGFCHLDTDTCWGNTWGLAALEKTIQQRSESAPTGSYTRKLFDNPELLYAKLVEEARELAAAITREETAWEAADVIYFALVAARQNGSNLGDIERELERRSKKVTRRPGNRKDGDD